MENNLIGTNFTYKLDDAWAKEFTSNWDKDFKAYCDKPLHNKILTDSLYKKEEAPEEWIWVEGYKGTNKDMKCRDYQFTLGSKYDMPKTSNIRACHSGFHFCKELKDVYRYYPIGGGHRFFKVSALVRKSESDNYGKVDNYYTFNGRNDKLAAKSILFTRELTPDEVFAGTPQSNWCEEDKREAMLTSINEVEKAKQTKHLVGLGYSEPFAKYVISQNYYEAAVAVSSQTDLSMDMKIVAILAM